MTINAQFELVREVLVDRLAVDEDEIAPESSLRDDLGMDSLDSLEFVSVLESNLGIAVPDEALGELTTVQDVVDFVQSQQADAGDDA